MTRVYDILMQDIVWVIHAKRWACMKTSFKLMRSCKICPKLDDSVWHISYNWWKCPKSAGNWWTCKGKANTYEHVCDIDEAWLKYVICFWQ